MIHGHSNVKFCDLLEKLTVVQPINKFPAFYGAQCHFCIPKNSPQDSTITQLNSLHILIS